MFCNEFYCGHPKSEHDDKHGCTHVNLKWANGKPVTTVCLCYVSYATQDSVNVDPRNVVVTFVGEKEVIL